MVLIIKSVSDEKITAKCIQSDVKQDDIKATIKNRMDDA
jgi:hypothetical protein